MPIPPAPSDRLRGSPIHPAGIRRMNRGRPFHVVCRLLAVLFFLAPMVRDVGAAEIVRVIPEYREGESFHRVSEFFTGRENPGRRAILRSDPEVRDGFYVKVRLRRTDRQTFPQGSAKLEVAIPDEQKTREYEYDLETVTRRRPLVLIGITGDHWPDELVRPLAWKISILDSDGNVLDSEQSFLWSINPDDEN